MTRFPGLVTLALVLLTPMHAGAQSVSTTTGAINGTVTDAKVLRSIPLLDAAALDAVRQWVFTPTTLNGQAVPVIMTVTVNFTLQ